MLLIAIAVALAAALAFAGFLAFRELASRLGALRRAADSDRETLRRATRPEDRDDGDRNDEAAVRDKTSTRLHPAFFAARAPDPLSGAWRSVRRALIETPSGQALTRDPHEIFSPDLLYDPAIDLRRFDAVPGLLVAIGLAITFALLALTIIRGVDALGADPSQMMERIGALLNASAAKFITSIAGIGASVLFIWFKNAEVRRTEAALAALADAVADAAPPLRAEALLADLAAQSARQTDLMAARDTRLANSIASALRAQLTDDLAAALKPVAAEMRAISTQVADVNRQQVELMATSFMSQVASVVHQMTRELADQMEQAVARFADVPPAIQRASDEFRTATDAGAENLKSTQADADAAYASLAQRVRGLAAELDRADTRVAERLAALDDGTRETLAGIREARDAIASSAADLAPLRAAAPALRDVAEQLAGAARSLRDAASAGDGARGRLTADLGQWHASLDQLDTRLAAVIDKVAPSTAPTAAPAAAPRPAP